MNLYGLDKTSTVSHQPNVKWNSSAPTKKPWRLGALLIAALSLLAFDVSSSSDVHAQAAPTVKEARDFWKDFDDHTLRGVGKHVRDVYGKDRAPQFIDDINRVIEVLGGCLDIEIKEAHGKMPTAEDKKKQDEAVKKVKDSGALGRLSKLQLDIMKDHFKDSAGSLDFAKLQLAFEMFANGELRIKGAEGSREMDQMNQWFLWKCFANIAIESNIDKSSWEKLIHSLEKSKEIYRRVYPPKTGAKDAGPRGELANPEGSESRASRFDETKQLKEDEKKKLRDEIDKLSVSEVLKREKNELAAMTVAAVDPCPKRNVQFAQIRQLRQGDKVLVQVGTRVVDAEGRPVRNTGVSLLTTESGFEIPVGRFVDNRKMNGDETGDFRATLLVPVAVLSLNLTALEAKCLAFATTSIAITAQPSETPGELNHRLHPQ